MVNLLVPASACSVCVSMEPGWRGTSGGSGGFLCVCRLAFYVIAQSDKSRAARQRRGDAADDCGCRNDAARRTDSHIIIPFMLGFLRAVCIISFTCMLAYLVYACACVCASMLVSHKHTQHTSTHESAAISLGRICYMHLMLFVRACVRLAKLCRLLALWPADLSG